MDTTGFRQRTDIEDRRNIDPVQEVLAQMYDQMGPTTPPNIITINELSRALGFNDLRNWNELMMQNQPMSKMNPWEI